ncbi:MAG: hypothetical protein LBM93_02955 [Oscillospiraceae bacterium]|jgi:hypothetical protein|nr:hypothetical protein [Oscillospiraceae bacterium]
MGLFSKKSLKNRNNHKTPTQQISIKERTDGLTALGLPSFLSPQIATNPTTLYCGDGTTLNITATSALITGVSSYRGQILIRQLSSAIKSGYTPIVLSSNGKNGEFYRALRSIYPESLIHYISDSNDSGGYNPFVGISPTRIADFFYQLITTFQQFPTNNMLIRNYINVCVRIFFSSGNAFRMLIVGQINHMGLIQEITRLCEQNIITEQEKTQLISLADSAREVSTMVLSIIQDYMYKMQRANATKPSIQIRPINAPKITILGGNNQLVQNNLNITNDNSDTYNMNNITRRECVFINIENIINGIASNAPNAQCFQWYLSRTLQAEFEAISNLKQSRILLIVENLSSQQLKWYYWLFNMPNCITILNYEDYYSALADSSDLREQLLGRMDRIFFFSTMNSQSAEWTSRFFGTHIVPKDIITDQPARNFAELLFSSKAIAHDQEEKPWYNSYEIQHLGDSGIVYCRRDKIFRPLYCENGNLYEDKNYQGQRINFCIFSFK